MNRPRRASARITLVLIGSAAAAGCAPSDPPQMRDHYASAEECAVDWGAPEYCERSEDTSRGGGYYFWRGPTYIRGTRDQLQQNIRGFAGKPGMAPTDRSIARSSAPAATSRGGFGSSSRGFSVTS
jgi:uncharacterized protein YgiB involved in biofilm formation